MTQTAQIPSSPNETHSRCINHGLFVAEVNTQEIKYSKLANYYYVKAATLASCSLLSHPFVS